MTKLVYVTGNSGKIAEAERILRRQHGIDFEAFSPDFEVLEPQGLDCGFIAGQSARYAADRLGKPCLKSDTGLFVNGLGGLPGPFNAYFEQSLGVEEFMALMARFEGRSREAQLIHCFAYCEPGKEPKIFRSGGTGRIADEPAGEGRWHDLFYIPDGETETLCQLRARDPDYEKQFWGGALDQFAEWYREIYLDPEIGQ